MPETKRKHPNLEPPLPSSLTEPVGASRKKLKNEHDTTTTCSSSPPPPLYGSQQYWEERYRRQFEQVLQQGDDDDNDDTILQQHKSGSSSSNTTTPYHAWYFTYDELRPLLLPLLLGGRQEARHILENAAAAALEEEEEDDDDENAEQQQEENWSSNSSDGDDGDNNNSNDFVESGEGDLEEEEEEIERDGLAKNGPISVLEVGCGDVPLGAAGLALELLDLQRQTQCSPRAIVKQILCTDYSKVVIDMMKKQYYCEEEQTNHKVSTTDDDTKKLARVNVGDVPLEFAVVDARKLPYDKESFHLILEKGTLDAMLADRETGVDSCIEIVTECARVLTIGGCLIIISHLNAHTLKGVSWMEKVVFTGLTNGGGEDATWEIEVHGSDQVIEETDDDDDEDLRNPPGSPGPAVYIINKKPLPSSDGASNERGEGRPGIPVKLFAY